MALIFAIQGEGIVLALAASAALSAVAPVAQAASVTYHFAVDKYDIGGNPEGLIGSALPDTIYGSLTFDTSTPASRTQTNANSETATYVFGSLVLNVGGTELVGTSSLANLAVTDAFPASGLADLISVFPSGGQTLGNATLESIEFATTNSTSDLFSGVALPGFDVFSNASFILLRLAFADPNNTSPGADAVRYETNARWSQTSLAPSAVPLPAGLPLLAAGLGVLGLMRRTRRG